MRARVFLAAVVMSAAALGGQGADDWVKPMKAVHARFTGQRGTVAQFGDSITITMALSEAGARLDPQVRPEPLLARLEGPAVRQRG